MPVIRINADGDRPRMHSGTAPVAQPLHRDPGDGPVIVMIHGWKYKPHLPAHCPHQHLFAFSPKDMPWRAPSWPRQMGFGTGHADEGLAIAFGWNARGAPWAAQASAVAAGRALAEVLNLLHRLWPQRPVHIMGHSMGVELALEALHHLPRGAVDRIISMTGASYRSRVEAALNTAAGRASEFYSITSRENDIVDFLFERLTPPPRSGDHSIGFGLEAPNAVTVQLDCPDTLDHLQAMGAAIGASQRRVCHWSAYTRPGVLRFYNALLRQPERWPLARIRTGLPETTAPRWSRLMAPPALPQLLPLPQKAS